MEINCRVCVRGHLEDRWSGWFENLTVLRQEDGTTVLTGMVADQAALHGVIARIRDLGLALVSINHISGDERLPA